MLICLIFKVQPQTLFCSLSRVKVSSQFVSSQRLAFKIFFSSFCTYNGKHLNTVHRHCHHGQIDTNQEVDTQKHLCLQVSVLIHCTLMTIFMHTVWKTKKNMEHTMICIDQLTYFRPFHMQYSNENERLHCSILLCFEIILKNWGKCK